MNELPTAQKLTYIGRLGFTVQSLIKNNNNINEVVDNYQSIKYETIIQLKLTVRKVVSF